MLWACCQYRILSSNINIVLSVTRNYLILLFLKVTTHFPSFALKGLPRSLFPSPVGQSAVYAEALVSSSLADERSHLRVVHATAEPFFEVLQKQPVPFYGHAVPH